MTRGSEPQAPAGSPDRLRRPPRPGRQPPPPADGEGPWPIVVLIHGGFWRWGWDRTLMTPLARDLAGRGFAAWNVEYRRVGQEGGGWPGTLDDAAAAVDFLAELEAVDPTSVVTVGHSAGGHLALWLAARHRIAAGAPGAAPRVRPCAAVSQAGVADLVRGAADGLGDGACVALLGGSPGRAAGSLRGCLAGGAPAARCPADARPRQPRRHRATGPEPFPCRCGECSRRRRRARRGCRRGPLRRRRDGARSVGGGCESAAEASCLRRGRSLDSWNMPWT